MSSSCFSIVKPFTVDTLVIASGQTNNSNVRVLRARNTCVATAPRNIDWRFFFIAGLSTHACAVNGTCG
jgi:hypothetical protein